MKQISAKITSLVLCGFLACGLLSFSANPAFASGNSRPITVNQSVTDSLSNKNDTNAYSVTLPSDGKVTLSFSHSAIDSTGNGTYWQATMYDHTEAEVLTFESKAKDTAGQSISAYLSAGDYTVKIKAPLSAIYYSDTSYTLTVNYEQNSGDYEVEPNDSRSSATGIPQLNQAIKGNLGSKGDVDFYKFTLTEAGKVWIDFNHGNAEKSGDFWQLTVFDDTEATLLTFNSKGNATTGTTANMYLSAGTYYARIHCPYSAIYYSDLDYTMTVNFEKNNGQYEIEPNNTKEKATAISASNQGITGNLSTYSDVDYYMFSTSKQGQITLGFNHGNIEQSGIYWRVALFDSNDSELLTYDSTGTNTTAVTDPVTIGAGTYYVRITAPYSMLSSNLDYILTVNTSDSSLLTGSGGSGNSGNSGNTGGSGNSSQGGSASDTPSSWAADSIEKALQYGLVPQDLQGRYTQNITRAEFCRMAVLYMEAKTGSSVSSILSEKNLIIDKSVFSDTQDDAILSANALGIVSGIGSGRFDPNGEITREQAASMLMRLQQAMGLSTSGSQNAGFTDSSSISSWALEGINYVYAKEIMSGVGNNRFDPQGKYTREQSIATFLRIYEQ